MSSPPSPELQRLFRAQDSSDLAREDTTVAVDEGDVNIRLLALAALAPNLAYCLNEEQEPVHPRMVVRQSPTVRVHRELPTWGDPTSRDERSALSLLAEPEILQEQHRIDRKGVVQHRYVHVSRTKLRHLERSRPGLGSGSDGKIRHLGDVAVPMCLPRPEQVDR